MCWPTHRTLKYFKLCFSCAIKSGSKFPKFHLTHHYYHFAQYTGTPALTYSGWFEKCTKFLVKVPYLRTNRNTKDLSERLTLRVVVTEHVRTTRFLVTAARKAGRVYRLKVKAPSGEAEITLRRVELELLPDHDVLKSEDRGFGETGYLPTGEE